MTTQKIMESKWFADKKMLVTHISGDVNKGDIEHWENSLKQSLEQIQSNDNFKIFVNMHGFKAIDIDAHKRFRAVIPLTLAEYGWKVGYVDLFEDEAKTMIFKNTGGIKCVTAAHSHQDETKMEHYETQFSSAKEHFFTDPEKAERWIEALEINN
ncbi:MAG: hypothetical protein KF845_09440 [Cyclobacteriaceae bacterium]|nr:hypothetical protein [Cyclobacteriaceae bacterium]